MIKKTASIIITYIIFTASIIYANNIAFFNNNICPPEYSLSGSLSPMSIYDALSPMPCMNDSGWWYFVGLIHDDQHQAHSLQYQIIRHPIYQSAFGLGILGFSFNYDNKSYYLWNASPDIFFNSLGCIKDEKATPNQFEIKLNNCQFTQFKQNANMTSFHDYFQHDPTDTTHSVGQLHARYILDANGLGTIMTSATTSELVNYQLHFTLQDNTGLLPEGFNGFVGPINSSMDSSSGKLSWEYTMPEMQPLSWNITITPIYTDGTIKHPLTFQHQLKSDDHLWMDRQTLYQPQQNSTNHQPYAKAMTKIENKLLSIDTNTNPSQELYFGTWMAFCIHHGKHKNTCGDVTAFWQPGTATNKMDSNINATHGFFNLFSISNKANQQMPVSNNLTALISPDKNQFPYRVINDPRAVFTSGLSGHHYAKVVYVTIDRDSNIGRLLTNDRYRSTEPIVLKFIALSKKTENKLVDNNNVFYEGAAKIALCDSIDPYNQYCQKIGSGFIEQMGYN